jgi:hypothetical protein
MATHIPAVVLEARPVDGLDPSGVAALIDPAMTLEPVAHPEVVAAFERSGATRIGTRTWSVGLGKKTTDAVFRELTKTLVPGTLVAHNLAVRNGRAVKLHESSWSTYYPNANAMRDLIPANLVGLRNSVHKIMDRAKAPFPCAGNGRYGVVVVSSGDTQLYFRVSSNHLGPEDRGVVAVPLNLAPAGRTPVDPRPQRMVDVTDAVEWAEGVGLTVTDPTGTLKILRRRMQMSIVASPVRGCPAQAEIFVGRLVPAAARAFLDDVPKSGEVILEATTAEVAALAAEPRAVISPLLIDAARMSAAREHSDDRLRPYQQVAVGRHLATSFGYVNASVPGTGKTVMTLVAHEVRAERIDRWRGLVVVDAALRTQWVGEAVRWFPGATVVELTSSKDADKLAAALSEDGPVLAVCSYPLTVGVLDAEPGTLGAVLAGCKFHDLAVDEAVVLRNSGTRQGQALWALRRNSDVAVVLTGTPISRGLDDLGRLVAFARNEPQMFDGVRLERQFPDLSTSAAQQSFNDALGPLVFRRDKSELAGELPRATVSVVNLEPTLAERNLARAAREELKRVYTELVSWVQRAERTDPGDPRYDAVKSGLAEARGAWLGGTTLARQACADPMAVAASQSAGAALLAGMGLVEAACAQEGTKRRWLRTYVPAQVEAGNPVVVFTEFSSVARHLIDDLRDAGVKVGAVLGGGGRARDADIAAFTNGELDVLVATAAGKRGHNWQRAKVVVQYDLPWTPEDVIQRTGRAERLGSTHDEITVVFPLLVGTIDERVAAVVVARAERAMQALDLSRGVAAKDSDFGRGLNGLRAAVSESPGGRAALMELCAAVVA